MTMTTLTARDFDAWLRGYKLAWESRDASAAAALFSPDAEYYWTPFDPPQRGKAEIAKVWAAAVSQQKDVAFTYSLLAVEDGRGVAHWHTRLTSQPKGAAVEIDGILIAEFASPQACRTFREWWHLVERA
jgi:ketosteroid isomerase-like protein